MIESIDIHTAVEGIGWLTVAITVIGILTPTYEAFRDMNTATKVREAELEEARIKQINKGTQTIAGLAKGLYDEN